jgi:hypothetical protein
MDGGSTGAGVTEEQPKPTLSSRLSAFYENLLAKKKDKTLAADAEDVEAGKVSLVGCRESLVGDRVRI